MEIEKRELTLRPGVTGLSGRDLLRVWGGALFMSSFTAVPLGLGAVALLDALGYSHCVKAVMLTAVVVAGTFLWFFSMIIRSVQATAVENHKEYMRWLNDSANT